MATPTVKSDVYSVKLHGKDSNGDIISYAPWTRAEMVEVYKDDGVTVSTVKDEISTLRTQISDITANGVTYRGVLNATSDLPSVDYKAGQQWLVTTAGNYAGQKCEVGDMVLCVQTYSTSDSDHSDDFIVYQANIDGAVRTDVTSTTDGNLVAFADATGKVVKDTTVSIDTVNTALTKLNGIEEGAQVNQNAFSNIKVGSTTVAADDKTDTLELVAGDGIGITADATNGKITIANTGVVSVSDLTSAANLTTAGTVSSGGLIVVCSSSALS